MPPTKVFISSASADRDLRDRLRKHLNVLAGQSKIDIWDDSQIAGGDSWRETLNRKVNEAQIVILLLSADFLTSDEVVNAQLPRLLERHEQEGLTLYPLVLKPCTWSLVPWLERMSIRPLNGQPITSSPDNIDHAFAQVAQDIAMLVQIEATKQRLQGTLDKQNARLESLSEQMKQYEIKEAKARSEISLNCDMEVHQYPTPLALILETRVSVKNNGRQTVCIPAAYISARSLAPTTGEAIFNFAQMAPLPPEFGSLAKTVNAAWVPDSLSIFQVAPDEIETLFRWDIINISRSDIPSIIVLNAEVCAASAELLGISYTEQREAGQFRKDWLSYMKTGGGNEHNLFSRATDEQVEMFKPDHINFGDRILLRADTSEPDIAATKRFHKLLQTVAQWTCNQVLTVGDNGSRSTK